MRLDDAAEDADDQERDKQHREPDPAGQRFHHAVAAALVGEHVIHASAEVVDDRNEETNDQYFAQHDFRIRYAQELAHGLDYSDAMNARWRRPSIFAMALLIVGVAAFLWLGFWQLRRADEKQRLFDAFALAETAAPVSLAEARRDDTPQHYPRVSVSGRYDGKHVYLLDNQTREGRIGVIVWMLFQPDEGGSSLLVDRGFLVQPDPRIKPAIPEMKDDAATLTGLYAPPPGIGLRLGGDALPGQASWPKSTIRIDRDEIARDSGRTLDTRVLLLDADPASGFERHWTPEVMVPDKHRAYALQWFSFAIAALVIFVVVHRRRPSKDVKK